jgi:hypothetical protein
MAFSQQSGHCIPIPTTLSDIQPPTLVDDLAQQLDRLTMPQGFDEECCFQPTIYSIQKITTKSVSLLSDSQSANFQQWMTTCFLWHSVVLQVNISYPKI